ncbi:MULTISPECIES: Ig-like domain-containing protein [unclassified Sphingomonas]|uniref:Ig-like domain-containing protein n=1 Tax=Sphingomonas sp. PvP015 TaxID=3156388 RepID=UPI00339693A3
MLRDATIGNEIFLQGQYLSLGINGSGTLGTRATAPVGFVTDAVNGYIRLGLVGDTDGFGKGAAPTRDAMLAGTPVESFSIGYDIGAKHYSSVNSERNGKSEVAGGVSSDLSSNGVGKAGWTGATTEGVKVAQTMSLADGAKYIKVDVTLTNTTGKAVADLHYMRSIDPDHGAGFDTVNTVIEQGGDGANGALIAAYASSGKTPLFYYTADDRAKVSTFKGYVNENPDAAATFDTAPAEGYSLKGDNAININFGLGTLAAGRSTTFTFYMGITDDLNATVAAIKSGAGAPPVPANIAPVAVDDSFAIVAGKSETGNVLTNDRDGDGDALTASLVKGPTHGSLLFNANGGFTYVADKGYVGSDSFTYAASDGKASDNGVVTIAVTAPPVTPPVSKPTIQDGSSSASQTLTGTSGNDMFFFDIAKNSGTDTIKNFSHEDVLATTAKLFDGNGDGIIKFAANSLSLDAPRSDDYAVIEGVSALRLMGTDAAGRYIYADASVRPQGAEEGTLANDKLSGDSTEKTASQFFFDTALGRDLGHDTLSNFGDKDVLVTTVALPDDGTGHVKLGAKGVLDLGSNAGVDLGDVTIGGLKGASVSTLEFDGAVSHDGTTYYVYSLDGSAAGTAALQF